MAEPSLIFCVSASYLELVQDRFAKSDGVPVFRLWVKISQVGFVLKAGFARAYYSSLERGERNVSTINLVRIARTLVVEVGELSHLYQPCRMKILS
ncbi:MAG: helix-turn-helix transcriptional regulator [Chloroflexia bacterium]